METVDTQTTAEARRRAKKHRRKCQGPPCNCHCKQQPCMQPLPRVMDLLPPCFPLCTYNPYADPNTVCVSLTPASCVPRRAGRQVCTPCTPADIIDRYTYWPRPAGTWCEWWTVACSGVCHVAALTLRSCQLGAWLSCLCLQGSLCACRRSCCRCC